MPPEAAAPPAAVPSGVRVYAIGDIHGRDDLLDRMFGLIARDHAARSPAREALLVFLGDYVDRGPASRDVLERLIRGLPAGFEPHFLMGNHERMLLDALEDPDRLPLWLFNGGRTTIESYAQAADRRQHRPVPIGPLDVPMPADHLLLLQSLDLSLVVGDYLFVHAGIRPGVPLEHQEERDLLWIREPFLGHPGSHGKVVVHGHTPAEQPSVRANRIGIDTGAYQTGRLTALCLEGAERAFLRT